MILCGIDPLKNKKNECFSEGQEVLATCISNILFYEDPQWSLN